MWVCGSRQKQVKAASTHPLQSSLTGAAGSKLPAMLCNADIMLQVVFTAIVTHDPAHAGEDTGIPLGHSEAEHLLRNKISCCVQKY